MQRVHVHCVHTHLRGSGLPLTHSVNLAMLFLLRGKSHVESANRAESCTHAHSISPLCPSTHQGKMAVIVELLAAGANPAAVSGAGVTPAMLASAGGYKDAAAQMRARAPASPPPDHLPELLEAAGEWAGC